MKIFTRLAACLVLSVTALNAVSVTAQTPSGDPVKLRIGFQKSSTLIAILKARGTLERAVAPLNVRARLGFRRAQGRRGECGDGLADRNTAVTAG